jgi:hypothetical protein
MGALGSAYNGLLCFGSLESMVVSVVVFFLFTWIVLVIGRVLVAKSR